MTTDIIYKVNTKTSNLRMKLLATQLSRKKLMPTHAKSSYELEMDKEGWGWAKMRLGGALHMAKWSANILKRN